MSTDVLAGGSPSARVMAAWGVALWAVLSVGMVALGAPEGLRLPVIAPFALFGVGVAAVIRFPDLRGATAWAMTLALGLGSLILISAGLVYAGLGGSSLGLATIAVQGVVSILLVSPEALGRSTGHEVA